MRLLVTGGCGFIGTNFIRLVREARPGWEIVNLDKLTYAGNRANKQDPESVSQVMNALRTGTWGYRFIKGDICDAEVVARAMKGVDFVVHFAAETHVDRSIHDASAFLKTNVLGTHVLLKTALACGVKRFLHVGTDEVYGDVSVRRKSKEGDRLLPNNPYAASKAAADHLVRSFYKTYGLPAIVTRSSNNFGPWQYPEKVVPLWITNAMDDVPLPMYGDGAQVRDWLFVLDHAKALLFALEKGTPGEIYNVGGTRSCTNLELARTLLRTLGKPESLIRRVADRPGHDRRYALDSSKLNGLGWTARTPFEEAIEATVAWYKSNAPWWRRLKSKGTFKTYYKKQYART